ncbi:MAG: DUF5723 family protein [Flavobacteriales bacterium]|nr:DUF5723 family protein [Flavobacteriales bacterium]
MKVTKFNTLLYFFSGLSFVGAYAQSFYGFHQDNYAGSYNWQYNPAVLGRTPYRFHANLLALDFNMQSSYLALDRDGLFQSAFFDDPEFFNKYVIERKTNRLHGLDVRTEFKPLGLTVGLGKHGGLGLSLRTRLQVNMAGLDKDLAEVIKNSLEVPELYLKELTSKSPKVGLHAFHEIALAYARPVWNSGKHHINVGITPKFLLGAGSAYLQATNLNYKIYEGPDTNIYFDVRDANLSFGYGDNVKLAYDNFQDFISSQTRARAFGIGLDLGATYEFSPRYEEYEYEMDGEKRFKRWLTGYLLRTGISLTDIGGVFYKNSPDAANYSVNRVGIPRKVFEETQSFEDISRVLDSLFVRNPIKRSYAMNLPGMLHWFGEIQPVQRLVITVSAALSLNPGKNDITKTRNWNTYGLSVRYEHPFFGIGTPAFYSTLSGFNWGAYLRLGPFNLGTPNLFSALLSRDVRALGFYSGLAIPVPYGKPRDKDNDKVSNRKDKCPKTAGVWEFRGCPDTDGDHVQDSEDDCPMVAGLKEFKGCPDTDRDGVPDKEDDCPKDSGLVKFKGCPDRDGDEIIDKKDECPDQKGLAQFNGCPDTDADGIPDKNDRCPKLAGPASQQGCPDRDNDGIFDDEDECVDVPGLAQYRGCPPPDRDNDGILDKDDLCPDAPGPAENRGCPYNDQDGDGIPDKDDRCPTLKGVPENNGCPPIKEEVQAKLRKVFENLEFETGKAIIRPTSFASLDELALELLKEPTYGLLIEGHTDNVGSRSSNLTLSKNRANAVKAYLLKRGVPERRIKTAWYGPDRPVADNSTPEGRQKNRRVEFTIIFQ